MTCTSTDGAPPARYRLALHWCHADRGQHFLLYIAVGKNTKARKSWFLADRDMWLYSGIPSEFKEIVFTHGYSIENDVLCCTAVHRLLTADERRRFASTLKQLARWFALEVNEYLAGRAAVVDVHINQIVPLGETTLRSDIAATRGYQGSPSNALESLSTAILDYMFAAGMCFNCMFASCQPLSDLPSTVPIV